MPGASGCRCRCRHPRAAAPARGRARARSRSRGTPPGRSSIGSVETADDGGFDADRRPRRRRRSGRSARQGRLARGPPWSARHGPTDWPTAPPPAPPKARRISRATGWAGTRIATVSRPAVARSATGQSLALGSTSVSGPGQNASASRAACGSKPGDLPRGREIADMGDQRIERRAGPWPGRAGRPRPHWWHRRRAHKRSRSGTRPARPRRARAPPQPSAASPAGKICVFRPTFTGISVLNSASCGARNPRL